MKSLIRTEIPDFAAFENALKNVRQQIDRQKQEGPPEPSFQLQYQVDSNDLLMAVFAAGASREQVLQLLNRDPIYEQLPFVERIPVYKSGELIWRTPLEHSLIRKRPVDAARFTKLLDQLEALLIESRVPHDKAVRREVLDAVARVRRDLQKETAYMPTSLQALEKKVSDYVHHSPGAIAKTRKERLDALLIEVIAIRHKYWTEVDPPKVMASADINCYKRAAQKLAKEYLDAQWMYTPWLTTYILATLLDAELMALAKDAPMEQASPAGVLKIIRDEVATGRYDGEETIRRLLQQEEKGLYVSSLVYPLLRLNITAAPARQHRGVAKNIY